MEEGVSERELADYGNHFDRLDQNRDGRHSKVEFVDQGFYMTPIARRGIERTRGVILVDEQGLLRSYYSSTCGGRPSSASGIWPTGSGFDFNRSPSLQARWRRCPCGDSPLYRWERTRDLGELRARIRAWGRHAGHPARNAGRVRAVDVVERNDAGRPERFRVSHSTGDPFEMSSEQFRLALNTPVRGQPSITRANRAPSGDCTVTIKGSTVHIVGQGFGHGVGLCQYGARGYALEGLGWREMLGRFYPGADPRSLWD